MFIIDCLKIIKEYFMICRIINVVNIKSFIMILWFLLWDFYNDINILGLVLVSFN